MIRLNKYLSSLGVASRRAVDKMLEEGRVSVNGKTASLGERIVPGKDEIKVDGQVISQISEKTVYIALNKPKAVLSTTKDDFGRQTVLDLVTVPERIFPVGRLDYNSTGLILLTNDGNFALKLTHPRYHLPKTYLVTVKGRVNSDKIRKMQQGIDLEEGKTYQTLTQIFHKTDTDTTLKITLYEGKKRQIRRMCAVLRLFVISLKRIQIGPIDLGNLKEGEWCYLSSDQVSKLLK